MSFRCEFCGKAQIDRTKPQKVVTKVREGEAHVRIISSNVADYYCPRQIVEEKMACPKCAIEQKNKKPIVVGQVGHKEEK